MNRRYTYRAYDLIFSSELPIPELEVVEALPEVEIILGLVPISLPAPLGKGAHFQATPGEFLLRIDDVAGFHVVGGARITIEPFSHPDDPEIRLFLLGSVFCALLQQRGYLALHGSAIELCGRGLLFTGRRGAGKSTIAAAFHDKGCRVLTDDVCAVRLGEDGRPYIVPGFPGLKLWRDSAEKLGRSMDGLAPVKRDMEKYRVGADARYSGETAVLNKVYVLGSHDAATVEITRQEGAAKLDALIKNTYRRRYVEGQGMRAVHFRQCAAVADRVNVFKVLRPAAGFRLSELVAAIEENSKDNGR
ncbi:MAG TPA: hypothetical protein VN445_09690 [Rectinemataceae bacterium]|nr:hypothetical protein [Rectinemataceae bacterium]